MAPVACGAAAFEVEVELLVPLAAVAVPVPVAVVVPLPVEVAVAPEVAVACPVVAVLKIVPPQTLPGRVALRLKAVLWREYQLANALS